MIKVKNVKDSKNKLDSFNSKKYSPGPLSQMEKGVEKFKNWYLRHLDEALNV